MTGQKWKKHHKRYKAGKIEYGKIIDDNGIVRMTSKGLNEMMED